MPGFIEENEIRKLLLMSMARELKKRAESMEDVMFVTNEYRKLRNHFCDIYPDACELLPEPSSISDINDVRYAIDQLVNYATAKTIPFFLKFIKTMPYLVENPLAPLLPILNELGLTINWVIACSSLALIEVMTNRKCMEMKLNTSGKFMDRFKRLRAEAEKKGVKLPNLLTKAFWDIRHKVIHNGEEPQYNELKLILEYLKILFDSFKKLKT